ncbi:MAG: LytTR family DNA-binding domain-containing protein [Pyrinomonadaceae bacterium]
MKHRAIIVDDERLARKEMRRLLAEHDEVIVVGEAEDLSEAVELINREKPNLIFLDIQLSNENGFDLLERVERRLNVIFVTAFDAYAIRAFEVNAIDYLVKPVNPERLAKSIKRLAEGEKEKSEVDIRKLEYEDRLFLDIGSRSGFLKIDSIKCIVADGDYTKVFTTDAKKHLVAKTLKEWESRLPEKHFIRIHRSAIVNLDFVEKVESWFGRSYQIHLKEMTDPLTVSRRYAAELKRRFN